MPTVKLSSLATTAPQKFGKEQTKEQFRRIQDELDDLQNLLYAEHKHSLLVVLQGMDASGKDGVIRNVFGMMNPMGVQVQPFKAPTEEQMDHDFLWRIHQHAPAKGMIQVFNRSHYEDVLVQRVHKWVDEKTIKRRFDAINDFEKLLTEHNDTHILKFYLHVSPEEQKQRLEERTQDPTKMWKYNEKDFAEAKLFKTYWKAYEDVFENCNKVPWIIVPADQNWYKEYVIAKTVRDTLKSLKMKFPKLPAPKNNEDNKS
ncbi:PPK2 family polyphosphate kinase [Chitinophaga niabensis]|uniref:Polyphosphate:nucleotide phosphotransferase, PPK2 family n=1 Tax=Chitinophaga niabensis TaxID=536979 RepID=A0A1N6JDU9_9BACT|nr:PPK2 family polyphosphate kinase [Chitinophaga niabensis]SIO42522.1 polyphosphate:nucleotide phosphotransferase, PPK2 family [Chitinophaga niabensis]